jgi:hypothetical protein
MMLRGLIASIGGVLFLGAAAVAAPQAASPQHSPALQQAILVPGEVAGSPDGAVVLAARTVPPSGAPVVPVTPQRRTGELKLTGMIIGLLLHEVGHAMIGELGLPAVGPEEDVADEFATIMYVLSYKVDPSVKDIALGSAEIWRLYDENRERKGWEMTPWFDEHAADLVRYGKILCMLYGADPEGFAAEMEAAGIPEDRREVCIAEFERKWGAWERLLRPHRRAIDPRLPGDQPADAPGGKVIVEHGKVYSEFGKRVAETVKAIRLLESVAHTIQSYYVLPRDLRINMFDCSEENAWYSEYDHAVTLCYGLIALMSELLGGESLTNNQSVASIPFVTGAQPTLPAQSTDSLHRALLGTWLGHTTIDGQAVTVRTEFSGDGTYTQLAEQEDGFTLTIHGGWSLQPLSSSKGRVASFPTAWSPPEYCSRGECRPLRLTPDSAVFTLIDRNTIEIEGERLQRVQ